MTRASTVLGAAPHPRGRCAAVPPTTVCPERPFRRPERPVRPSSWRDTMAWGSGSHAAACARGAGARRSAFGRRGGATARRGSPSLKKRWLKIHQEWPGTCRTQRQISFDHRSTPSISFVRIPNNEPFVLCMRARAPARAARVHYQSTQAPGARLLSARLPMPLCPGLTPRESYARLAI